MAIQVHSDNTVISKPVIPARAIQAGIRLTRPRRGKIYRKWLKPRDSRFPSVGMTVQLHADNTTILKPLRRYKDKLRHKNAVWNAVRRFQTNIWSNFIRRNGAFRLLCRHSLHSVCPDGFCIQPRPHRKCSASSVRIFTITGFSDNSKFAALLSTSALEHQQRKAAILRPKRSGSQTISSSAVISTSACRLNRRFCRRYAKLDSGGYRFASFADYRPFSPVRLRLFRWWSGTRAR